MATVYQYFDKDTFIPEKNYFSTEKVKCSREETEVEIQLYNKCAKWATIGFTCIFGGGLVGIIFLIVFGLLGSIINPLFVVCSHSSTRTTHSYIGRSRIRRFDQNRRWRHGKLDERR